MSHEERTPTQSALWTRLKDALNGVGSAVEEVFATGGGGEVNTGNNVGQTGAGTEGVFRDKTGTTLNFRRLTSSSEVSVQSADADTIQLTLNPGAVGVENGTNIGTGSEVFAGVASGTAQYRTLKPGTNIDSITQTATELTINASTPTLPAEQYYNNNSLGNVSSGSGWQEVDDNDFTVVDAQEYWVDIRGIVRGNNDENRFGIRFKVDGNIVAQLEYDLAEDEDRHEHCLSWLEPFTASGTTMTVSVELIRTGGTADGRQWCVHLREKV